jgi:hypothetical protein
MRAYHFLSERNALDDLQRGRLKVSRLADMNDPFELLPAALTTKQHRIAMGGFRAEVDAKWGTLCFARGWSNPVLWSHYADRHRGVCLGFEVPKQLLTPVEYTKGRLQLDIEKQLNKATQDAQFGLELMRTKYEDWRYEDELRAIIALNDRDPATGLFFAEFGSHLKLVEVIVGVRSQLSKAAIGAKISDADQPVMLKKARLAFKTFRVVRQNNEAKWLGPAAGEPNHALQPTAAGANMSRRD